MATDDAECYRCGIPETVRCKGCGKPVCAWCDIQDNGWCTKRCRRESRQHDLFKASEQHGAEPFDVSELPYNTD